MPYYRKWDIYLAKVKYEDVEDYKIRPVLVLQSGEAVTIECLKMTGQPPRAGEYILREWRKAGLRKQTVVRVGKRLRLRTSEIIKRIGRLDLIDMVALEQLLDNNFIE